MLGSLLGGAENPVPMTGPCRNIPHVTGCHTAHGRAHAAHSAISECKHAGGAEDSQCRWAPLDSAHLIKDNVLVVDLPNGRGQVVVPAHDIGKSVIFETRTSHHHVQVTAFHAGRHDRPTLRARTHSGIRFSLPATAGRNRRGSCGGMGKFISTPVQCRRRALTGEASQSNRGKGWGRVRATATTHTAYTSPAHGSLMSSYAMMLELFWNRFAVKDQNRTWRHTG